MRQMTVTEISPRPEPVGRDPFLGEIADDLRVVPDPLRPRPRV
jgi:hypothetical protein